MTRFFNHNCWVPINNASKIPKVCMYYAMAAVTKTLICWLQVVTIDRERLISEKRNNKGSAEGARFSKGAILLRDIYKFTKPSLDAFYSFGLISRACQGPRNPPIALTLTYKNDPTQSTRLTCRLLLNQFRFAVIANR